MIRNRSKSNEERLKILREYLTTDHTKSSIQQKYGLDPNWILRNLVKFAIADKNAGMPMKKSPDKVSAEKDYRESEREDLLRRIRELEITLRETEMARDAYDEMIRLAEQYYNIPIRKKSAAK